MIRRAVAKSKPLLGGKSQLGFEFKKTTLANGLRIVTERHPVSRAVCCGVWIDKGTRDERGDSEAGVAHFIEHLVFKRTKNRSAYDIARDMEAVGGDLNAFTSRENTCFMTVSLKEHLGLALDVLSDLVARPVFHPSDIKKEKHVVIQEIHMSEDQLEDSIFDRYFERAYPNLPLGKSILGTAKSIAGMKRETILDFHRRTYTPKNMVVSVAGGVDHEEVVALVRKHLRFTENEKSGKGKTASSTSGIGSELISMTPFKEKISRPSEQMHILLGLPAADFRAPLRFEGLIVNSLLGGGMTSRLYQTVREDRGLVYSIYSQLVTFVDTGQMLIYAGAEPKEALRVVELTLKEIKKLRREGVARKDLEFFKTQVKGQILLGADDIDNRMNSLAVNEMVFGRYRSVDEVIQDIDRISPDSIHSYIETYLDLDRAALLLMGAGEKKSAKK